MSFASFLQRCRAYGAWGQPRRGDIVVGPTQKRIEKLRQERHHRTMPLGRFNRPGRRQPIRQAVVSIIAETGQEECIVSGFSRTRAAKPHSYLRRITKGSVPKIAGKMCDNVRD